LLDSSGDEESPLQRMQLQPQFSSHKGLCVSDQKTDGKVYYPNNGNPFRLVETYDKILPVDFLHPLALTIPTGPIEDGLMEAEANIREISDCEHLYKQSKYSVQLLLAM
jgi:hypothetical protein